MIPMLQPKYLSTLFLFFFFVVSISFFFFGKENYKPLHLVSQADSPKFSDDLDYRTFLTAAKRHAAYLREKKVDEFSSFGQESYSTNWLLGSLQAFIKEIDRNPASTRLHDFIVKNYDIYQAGGRKDKKDRQMLVTGYYEPLFKGSLTKVAPYLYPIYSPPDSLVKQKGDNTTHPRIGRIKDNTLINYWNREEIETLGIARGYELVYLKDPFDAFLLHVQGSGRISLPDGSVRAVRFAASNGLEYNSIGKLLVDEKKLSLDEVTVPAIRKYLNKNPDELQRVLHHNPRFIFFNWGDNLGPRGSSGTILTPGRSIAIDNSTLPDGAIAYLTTKKPVINQQGKIIDWASLNRFVFPQDSGAAIKGAGRVDLFWGHGNYAELAASHMKEDGKLYFLVKKGASPSDKILSKSP